jgi:hypothetical protein
MNRRRPSMAPRAVSLLVAACVVVAMSPITRSTASATATGLERATSLSAHRIAVRSGSGGPELYDRTTGHRFVPRGANYLRFVSEGGGVADTLFRPSAWAPGAIEADLHAMHQRGYNAVRVALDICQHQCIGDPRGGLDQLYLDHVVDFLRLAKQAGIQVILFSNDLPVDGGYVPQVEATCCDPFDGYMNSQYLSPVGYRVYRDYWKEIVRGLISRHAPLSTVLSYELRNEMWLFGDHPPLSKTTGSVTTANGSTYDLSKPAQRRRMVAEGMEFWLDGIRHALRQLDPTALVSIDMFPPDKPNPWQPFPVPRVVPAGAAYRSDIDFVGIHPYPGYYSFGQLAENFGLERDGTPSKVTVMGEYGAFRFRFPSPASGATALMDWQVASCRYGVQGWFHWHWSWASDPEVWTGSNGGGKINTVLAPAERPDPCRPKAFPFLERNLSIHATATASTFLQGEGPGRAIDDLRSTIWNAGTGPPSWIEVHLQATSTVTRIRLIVEQSPAGDTTHEVWVRRGGSLDLVHVFSAATSSGDVLSWVPAAPLDDVSAVRIVTTSTPSWVAWAEVQVWGR